MNPSIDRERSEPCPSVPTSEIRHPKWAAALWGLVLAIALSAAALAGAPGASGDLYVPVGDADSVVQYDGVSGAYLGDFVTSGSGGLGDPIGVAFDAGGTYLWPATPPTRCSNRMFPFIVRRRPTPAT